MSMRWRSGQSLAEAILAIAIFTISMTSVVAIVLDAGSAGRREQERIRAVELAQEGLEATRAIRDAAFANLTVGNHGLAISSGRWVYSGSSDAQGAYTRVVAIGAPDDFRRNVTSTVSWVEPGGQSRSVAFYSRVTDWRTGAGSPPVILNPGVILNLPGVADGISVTASGTRAYVGREVSAASAEFAVIDISNTSTPILIGELELGASADAIAIYGSIVYVGTRTNTQEMRVIDVTSSTAPSVVTTVNLAGTGDVKGLFVSGTRLYVATTASAANPTFHVIDIATPTAPVVLGSLNTGSDVSDVVITTGPVPFALLASSHDTQELQVVNVITPISMIVGGSYDLTGTEDLKGIAVSGSIAFVGSVKRSTAPEFIVFDVSSPLLPTELGNIEFDTDINVVRMLAQNSAIALGTASNTRGLITAEAHVPTSPAVLSQIATSEAVVDLSLIDNLMVAVMSDDNAEVVVSELTAE